MRKLRRRIIAGLVIAVALWTGTLATHIWRFGNNDAALPSDCVIVLGAAAYGDLPSPVFAERIRHAVTLYRQGVTSRIIFTGGCGTGSATAESSVAAKFAIKEGVPESAILTETTSKTTRQNLQEARAVMETHSLKSAIIISDPLHLRRASFMAKDLGIAALTSPTPTSKFQSWSARLGFLAREVYLCHHYWISGE